MEPAQVCAESVQKAPSVRARLPITKAGHTDNPFWKIIPRFPRESTTYDLLRSFRALAQPRIVPSTFEGLFPSASAFDYSQSGRESLYLILRSLGLPRGARIGVPLYCCDAVFMAIGAAGFVPVFLDIELETYALDPESLHQRRNEIDALIVVHTFGYPANFASISEVLSDRAITIIEDCAHSLFSEYCGQLTGSFTDASFFTFGCHKPAPAGGGGVIVANKPEVAARVLHHSRHRDDESRMSEAMHALTRWARGLCYMRPVYGALLSVLPEKKREQKVDEARHRALVQNSEATLSTHTLRRVDGCLVDERIAAFRSSNEALARNAERLRASVAGSSLHIPQEPRYGTWNHFMLPLRFASDAQRESGRALLRRKGVDTSPLYRNCVTNASVYGYRGGCPQAELASKTVCTLPVSKWLSDQDVEGMCFALQSNF
jgi:dTDP-4-amino-4,6-dideoxygalactose transaminase